MGKKINTLLSAIAVLFFVSCKGHDCVGEWHATFERSYDSSISETWFISINDDGTCYGSETGSGNANYVYEYEGSWKKITGDVIYVHLETGNIGSRRTYSNKEIGEAMSKARTDREANRIYNEMQGTHYSVSNHQTNLYLRSDGAAATSYEGLDNNPKMHLTKR